MGEKAPSSSGLPGLKYHVLALLLVTAGVIVRAVLTHLIGPGLATYITFYPAVMLAALVGGWRPGFLATLATLAVVDYWLLLPVGLFSIDSRVEIVGLAFFGAMGIFMSIVAGLYRRTRDHLEELVSLRTTALTQANGQLRVQGEKLQAWTEELTAANIALRKSEERWATTLASIGDAVISTDVGGRITFMNSVAETLTGWTIAEASRRPVSEVMNIFNDDTRQAFDNPVTKVLQEGKFVGLANHTVLIRKDGVEVPIDDSGAPIKDMGGNTSGVVLVFRDISERIRAEEAVEEARRSAERERNLLQSMIDSARNSHLVYLDRGFNFVRVNDAYARTCGYSPEEMIGKNHFALYAHDENEAIFARVRDTGAPVEFHDKAFVFPDQPERGVTYWDWTLTPVKDRSGAVDGLVFSLFETTERKRAEEALKQSEAGLARAQAISHLANWEVEVGADGILGTKDDTVRGSAELYRMFNLEKHHTLGAYMDKFHPDDRSYVVESINAAVHGGKPYKVEYRIIPRAGEIRHVYAEGEVIRDEKGLALKFFGTVQDVTERKRMEEELRRSRDELEVRVQQRTAELSRAHDRVQFFASQCLTAQESERKRIAGELHDCIAASVGAVKFRIEQTAEEMKQGKGGPESLQNISSMISGINNDIRRIMADLRPSVLDDLGIIAAINWFCREYRETYSHVSVETQIALSEDDVPGSLKTPIFRISQEAMNNIAKHSKATVVTVSLKRGSGIELVIRDNGQGFDMETVRRGMGSSTMRERCELAGGTFTMESVKGAGTKIRCTWPST